MTTTKISFNRLFTCIDFIRDKQGLSVEQFCEQIKTTPNTYKKWLDGNTKSFKVEHIRAICQALTIPPTNEWLKIFEPDQEEQPPEEMRTT